MSPDTCESFAGFAALTLPLGPIEQRLRAAFDSLQAMMDHWCHRGRSGPALEVAFNKSPDRALEPRATFADEGLLHGAETSETIGSSRMPNSPSSARAMF